MFIVIKIVFTALEYESSESQGVAVFATFENFPVRKSVSLNIFVTALQTAVIAIVFTVVGKFYKSSYKDFTTVIFNSDFVGNRENIIVGFTVGIFYNTGNCFGGKILVVDEILNHIIHKVYFL